MLPVSLDPNLAYLILVVAFVVAVLALLSPGTIYLEVISLIAILFVVYATSQLPINTWALAVLLAGVFPFILALRRYRRREFLVLSMLALAVGSIFFFRGQDGLPVINPFLAAAVTVGAVSLLWIVAVRSLEAMQRRPFQQPDAVIGKVGVAQSDIEGEGVVYVGGEQWTARSAVFIPKGATVRVVGRQGLVLLVEPASEEH